MTILSSVISKISSTGPMRACPHHSSDLQRRSLSVNVFQRTTLFGLRFWTILFRFDRPANGTYFGPLFAALDLDYTHRTTKGGRNAYAAAFFQDRIRLIPTGELSVESLKWPQLSPHVHPHIRLEEEPSDDLSSTWR